MQHVVTSMCVGAMAMHGATEAAVQTPPAGEVRQNTSVSGTPSATEEFWYVSANGDLSPGWSVQTGDGCDVSEHARDWDVELRPSDWTKAKAAKVCAGCGAVTNLYRPLKRKRWWCHTCIVQGRAV